MNTVHSTSATLASLNSTDVYDSDGIVPRESPPLQQKTLKLRITPSPPPKVTEVSRRSLQASSSSSSLLPHSSSSSTSRHRSSSNRRRKAKPSLGQTVLLQHMTGGRNPDIAHFASQCIPSDDDSEDEDDEEDEDDRTDDIGRTRESTSEFLNNPSDSENEDDDSNRIASENHKRLFLGKSRPQNSNSTNARPSRPKPGPEAQPQRQQQRQGSPKAKGRQQSPNERPGSDDGDDAMSLDEPSPPPPRPQQQNPERPGSKHEHDKTQQQGQDHERQRPRQRTHSTSAAGDDAPFANLAAIAMAAAGAISRPGQTGPTERTLGRRSSSTGNYTTNPAGNLGTTSELGPPPPRSPGVKRDYNGMLKTMSSAPGSLHVDSSIPYSHPHHGRSPGSMDAPGSRSGGGLSPELMRRQYSSSSQSAAVPAYSPRPGSTASHQDHASDQSQVLTPASAITPGTMSASLTSFPPILPRDDRSVVGSTGSVSLATPSSTHSPNDYQSAFSPNGSAMAASPAHITAFSPRSQADFHLSRQSSSSALSPLPPIQPYGSPRHDINSAASPMSAGTPAGHTPSNHSSTGSVSQSQYNSLPPIREHLLGPLTEPSPTGSGEGRRPPPFLPSTGYTRLPSMSHSHHSSPTSPDEVYRRNSEIASPNSSVGNVGSHPGSAQTHYLPPSAPSSNYGGSRRGTIEYGGGGDTPASESHYAGTPGSTGRPAGSPGRLLNPMTATTPGGGIVLPPVRHDSMPRQQPTIESLTSHMQPHSPNGQQHIPPLHPQPQQQQSHLRPPLPPPPPPPQQQQSSQQVPSQAHATTQGPYKCKEPGCTAAPFPTQYLLNSHANVHSSARPHYCPVRGCPRSETGKGFKRKNEMIRHGLVHQSPGYVCPFCPDREHKYPRPDNLQRHVRVHHKDRSKDDPLLRDVLAQRAEGPSRGRRRRL